jgi:hypothetical protein
MAQPKLIPVACTLDGDDLRQRAGEWTALIATHARSRREVDDGVEIRFDTAAAGEVERLAAGERACCGWATWSVAHAEGAAVLRATSPDATGTATLRAWLLAD